MQTRLCSHLQLAVFLVLVPGCLGAVEGVESSTRSETEYLPCTDYHKCCPPSALECEGDVDTSTVCTCAEIWTCHPGTPEKCEKTKPVPPADGPWSCSWSTGSYRCVRGGSEAPLAAGAGGQWTCKPGDEHPGWECRRSPPNPSNQPGGESSWDCSVDNENDKIFCQRQVEPPAAPPPPTPKPKQSCVQYPEQTCAIPDCNTHTGDNEAACLKAGNPGGCTPTELKAWCRRRVDPEPGNLWYQIHKQWVDDQCSGSVKYTDDNGKGVYTCVDEASCEKFKCVTPLVLVFQPGRNVAYHTKPGQSGFDLSGAQDGSGTATDWPTAATPWLALDLNGDGQIDSGRELLGSATLVDGHPADNGFEALTPLDANRDGILDPRDPAFARLLLWSDRDGDRVSRTSELMSLSEAGVVSVSLRHRSSVRCDHRGNCEVERASLVWRDANGQRRHGELVDVHLAVHSEREVVLTCDGVFRP